MPAGYAEWAEMYDGPNPLIETEELVVRPILERVAEPGVQALDAACGTGRHAAYLHDRGCTVTGVDQSLEMLAVARNKLPEVHFEQGDIEQLAFADGSFDLVVIALALCHLADPTAAVAELARVLRPGGTLVIADPHPAAGVVGGQAFYGSIVPGRPMTWVRNHYHRPPPGCALSERPACRSMTVSSHPWDRARSSRRRRRVFPGCDPHSGGGPAGALGVGAATIVFRGLMSGRGDVASDAWLT